MTEQWIGAYKVERKVSSSGLSIVYAAINPRTGRRVAIKVADSPTGAENHEAVVSRFRSESALLAAVKDASIPEFYEEGTQPDGSPYFVMEWIEGRTLETILKSEGHLPVREALSIARQVAGALGAAHARGYVHRDAKPSNIMVLDTLEPDGLPDHWTAKLLDFGVGGTLLAHSQVTTANGIFGTVLYMSPEQLRGEGVSPRSDVWQLGIMLFEMLTGGLPYQRGETYAVVNAILNVPMAIPAEAHLSAGMADFLLRCLAKDPAMRPADGYEARKEIERLLLSLPPLSVWANVMQAAPVPARLVAALPAEKTSLPNWANTTLAPHAPSPSLPGPVATSSIWDRWGLKILIGLCVLLVAFVGFLLLHPPAALSPLNSASDPASLSPLNTVQTAGSRSMKWNPWSGVALGMGLAFGGMMLGKGIQTMLTARFHAISQEAQMVLNGDRGREQLSHKLASQVDDIVAKCRMVDEKFMAMTLAVMVDEYGASATSDERQKALMNAVSLLEKLMTKLSPWYVRHDKLIALLVTLVGVLSGLATVAQNVVKLVKGS